MMALTEKFARDTQRARLEWLKAKMFVSSSGGVTERKIAVDVSEELARKGQELREMTRDLDLLKVDVDILAMIIRLRGVSSAAGMQAEIRRTANRSVKAPDPARHSCIGAATATTATEIVGNYPSHAVILRGRYFTVI